MKARIALMFASLVSLALLLAAVTLGQRPARPATPAPPAGMAAPNAPAPPSQEGVPSAPAPPNQAGVPSAPNPPAQANAPMAPNAPNPPMPPDPLADVMFPPDMVLGHARQLNLTDEQKAFVRSEVQSTMTRFNELQWKLQDEMESLHETLSPAQ